MNCIMWVLKILIYSDNNFDVSDIVEAKMKDKRPKKVTAKFLKHLLSSIFIVFSILTKIYSWNT